MPEKNPLVAAFKKNARAVQADVADVRSVRQALREAVELTAARGGKTLAAPGLTEKDQAFLSEACAARGIAFVVSSLRERPPETGVTLARWGVADTGTIVLDAPSEDERLATMLPDVHVAILRADDVAADLSAIEEDLRARLASGAGYVTFISGPSRTADIERVLTLGVHGPVALHVLIVKEPRR